MSTTRIDIDGVSYLFSPMKNDTACIGKKACIVRGETYVLREVTATKVSLFTTSPGPRKRSRFHGRTPVKVMGSDAIYALVILGVGPAEGLNEALRQADYDEAYERQADKMEWHFRQLGLPVDKDVVHRNAEAYAKAGLK